MEKRRMKKLKIFVSYQKERIWLEQMAQKGWFLSNISLGIFYSFQKGEPKKMMYEVDRFNLPKKPTLEEIRHKEIFMDVAKELGWQEVTHDEGLTYYFCKEYKEGDINELYNDEESRKQRGDKFNDFIQEKAQELVFWSTVLLGLDIIILLLHRFTEIKLPMWYTYFVLGYIIISNLLALGYWKIGKQAKEELSLSREEWESKQDSTKYKTEKKLILTVRRLKRFLEEQEKQGWILTGVTLRKYFFVKKEEHSPSKVYTMDSQWLTNKRQKARQLDSISDKKDWEGKNNDWQVQSLKDAEEKGWKFVCALENRAVIYCGDTDKVEMLNDGKYDNSLRGISLIGAYGFILLVAGCIGAVFGFAAGIMGL